ncbi:GNAT family N-acetyltransferase [Mucilaginibacter sp. KACC 22773]|uniref:GNAT family N-acetyltransferase n=1 Tax=Mucilaginibacter sp. KACC 22773 TaxID=3025671 RepID=UPI002366F88F|nr:GNAT family N-acetyltransferase [Mucilaginibacter sp. KACC 22773]WDF78644.1 GNAT family N-acetyltransferase [Mucilaginibacter sp. KACC 22773]
MEIQVVTTADIEAITRVEIDSKLQSFPELMEPHDIDFEIRAYRWKTYFAKQSPASARPQRVIFKAIDQDRMVGYLAVHLTSRYDKDAEIQSFYVLKEYQRRGIGTALLKEVASWAMNLNAKSLCVGIAPENPYQQIYLKYGGTFLNPHWIVWDDINLLKSKLG